MRAVWTPAVVVATVLSIGVLWAQAPGGGLPAGDAARGRAIVFGSDANCLGCHSVGGVGSLYGPDLTAVSAVRGGGGGRGFGRGAVPPRAATSEDLARSLTDPNAEVAVENRYVRLTMTDGRTVWGKLLNLDTFAVQIFDANENLSSVPREDVRELTMASPMPSYRDRLAPQALADVVAYLMTLNGQ